MNSDDETENWETMDEITVTTLTQTTPNVLVNAYMQQYKKNPNNNRTKIPPMYRSNVPYTNAHTGSHRRWSQSRFKNDYRPSPHPGALQTAALYRRKALKPIQETNHSNELTVISSQNSMKNSTICEGGVALSATLISGLSPIRRRSQAASKQAPYVASLTPAMLKIHCLSTSPDAQSKVKKWLASTQEMLGSETHSGGCPEEVAASGLENINCCSEDESPASSCLAVQHARTGKGKRKLMFAADSKTDAEDKIGQYSCDMNRNGNLPDIPNYLVDSEPTNYKSVQNSNLACPDTLLQNATTNAVATCESVARNVTVAESQELVRKCDAVMKFMIQKRRKYRSMFSDLRTSPPTECEILMADQCSNTTRSSDAPTDILKFDVDGWSCSGYLEDLAVTTQENKLTPTADTPIDVLKE